MLITRNQPQVNAFQKEHFPSVDRKKQKRRNEDTREFIMAKVIKFELVNNKWDRQTVKANLTPKKAKDVADKLNNVRDNDEQTLMVCYAVEK